MTLKKLVSIAVMALTLVACGGGGGSSSQGGIYFTHEELAEEFVYRLNIDIYGYDVSLVKANTEQFNYIVVRDFDLGTYDAYYIGGYNVGENLNRYLNDYESLFYYDLTALTYNNLYESREGILFDKVQENQKNLSQIQANVEKQVIVKMAEKLRTRFVGLSVERSQETARFAYNIQTQPKGTYDLAYYDAFVKQETGSSIDQWKKAIESGESDLIDQRVAEAEKVSGMGPEGVAEIFGAFTDLME